VTAKGPKDPRERNPGHTLNPPLQSRGPRGHVVVAIPKKKGGVRTSEKRVFSFRLYPIEALIMSSSASSSASSASSASTLVTTIEQDEGSMSSLKRAAVKGKKVSLILVWPSCVSLLALEVSLQ